jgi:hypothetical protein
VTGDRRPGGRPRRKARAAGAVTGPVAPTDPTLPVHRAAAERAASYVWEDFRSGNFLSVRSGHHSPRIVSRLADALARWIVEAFPDLSDARYRLAVGALCRAEAVAALLTRRLDDVGVTGEDGEPREALLRELRAAERRASEERRNLGLDPASHAKLESARSEAVRGAVDLSQVRARGRAALEARKQRELVEHLRGDDEHLRDGEELP